MNTPIIVNVAILNRLISLVEQLSNDDYTKSLNVLSGNSIGKHIRHIIEFYECLIQGYADGVIDYDLRERNKNYEEQVLSAVEAINLISEFVAAAENKQLILHSTYSGNSEIILSSTSFSRELVYNIEHAIHHMAIIKIAVNTSFPNVILPNDFGIAYSTIQHLNQQCAQ